MSKHVVLFLFLNLLMLTHFSFAQEVREKKLKFGVAVGVNYSDVSEGSGSFYTPDVKFKQDQLKGVSIGLRAKYSIHRSIDLLSGLNYNDIRYQIGQYSFTNSGLQGSITTIPNVNGLELPAAVIYRISSKNKFLNNTLFTVGGSIALYEFGGIISKIQLREGFSDTIFWEISELSFPKKKTIVPAFQIGLGKQFRIGTKELQCNFSYSVAIKPVNTLTVSYLLNKEFYYEIKSKPVASAFKFEFVFYPFAF